MKLKLYSLLLGTLLFASCSKLPDSVEPEFEVTTSKPTYKVGEEVQFNFKGGADMIAFYPGQEPNDYAFKDGRVIQIADKGVELLFQTAVTLGTQTNQLSVMASTDFNGDYENFSSVQQATWTDITSKFVYGTNTTFRASNTGDISDLVVPGKPLYIAFKYVTRPQKDNGVVRQWQIQSFVVRSKAEFNGAPVTIANQAAAGFRIVDANKANAPARSSITSTRVTLWGNLYKTKDDPMFNPENPIYDPLSPSFDPEAKFVPFDSTSIYNDYPSENWAISAPLSVDQVDLGPDWSIAVKGMETTPTEFLYPYSAAGTYKAYFIATNGNIKGVQRVIREVEVTIEPR
ncbi:MAG: DUF5017 domain-containing protein [Adhaeribacter sp.]